MNFYKRSQTVEKTWKQLDAYAREGLRTLILAKRPLSKEFFKEWSSRYHEATTSLLDREKKMDALQEEIEKSLELVGATAIEDKLQDKVGLTVSFLREAGIQIWVLTGDKIETAINIGYSCQLLNETMEKILIDGKKEEEVQDLLLKGMAKV